MQYSLISIEKAISSQTTCESTIAKNKYKCWKIDLKQHTLKRFSLVAHRSEECQHPIPLMLQNDCGKHLSY